MFSSDESSKFGEDEIEPLLAILKSSTDMSPQINSERLISEVDSISEISPRVLIISEEEILVNKDFDDLVTLFNCGKEKEVVQFIGRRYLGKEFYTWIGEILLAVNPYEEHKLKSKKCIKEVHLIPSIKSITDTAWFKLCIEEGIKRDQSIVISGDSGSGKTYSSCSAIKHILTEEFEMSHSDDYKNIILQAWSVVPLLSAFGNARNSHNNNSSRFGQLLQLQYANSRLVGAHVHIYMLEKSRVARVNNGEGNFHIFSEILNNFNEADLKKVHLYKETIYKIAPKVNSVDIYKDIRQAVDTLNIYEFNKVVHVLSIILNLGNISFQSIGNSFIIDPETEKFAINVAELLGTTEESLSEVLCTVRFSVKATNLRNSSYQVACTNWQKCNDRRDCLIKYLYQRVFDWLVKRINRIINCANCEEDVNNLNILDIYGFETIDNNTFEQLCINYANERLLQFYATSYLLEKQIELESEKLMTADIDISEYQSRLSLIDGNISIFSILNEEVNRFNTDITLNKIIVGVLRGHPYFIGPLSEGTSSFSIKHYAGIVQYNSKDMLVKNKDKVPGDIINFLKECNFGFLINLMNGEKDMSKKSTLVNFKKSLDSLVKILNNSEVHYIKCLKPNQFQITGFFDEDYFTQQMEANAIFETFKVNNLQKYSIRMNIVDFSRKFPKHHSKDCFQFSDEDFHMGNKFVYFTEIGYYTYQQFQLFMKNSAARKLQRFFKNVYNERNNAAFKIQRFFHDIIYKRNFGFCQELINLSKTNSELDISMAYCGALRGQMESTFKICDFLNRHDFKARSEGAQLSLILEKISNRIQTKPFKRTLFYGDRIVSYFRIAEIPVRLHTSKTCIKYSNLLPRSEIPKGLLDILL